MATDANIEFTGTYPAEVKEPGLVGVNGRNFVDLIRRLPAGELRIRLDDATGTVILEQGRRTYKLPRQRPHMVPEPCAVLQRRCRGVVRRFLPGNHRPRVFLRE